ncbi:hypothetical protein DPMN_008799 [Dreissena polymorpha]|uniref:Uncharacterized protein n=1 Tax=Dreissena polymorpha TaxID=45954 RepID=A0A9D4N019_DREPO|nr:hypothetical protein DPMN_008799 [Dreissena polymorpha]
MILGISALELSSGNHLVDGRTNMSKTILPLFFESGGHNEKTAPIPAAMFQDIIGTNLQTKFHDDRKIIGHAFLPIQTIFELNCHIQKTHVLTKFHEHWTKNVTSRVFPCFHYIHIEKNAPLPGGHVFSPILTIFELDQEINKTNVLTNFHDDWAKIVTSRVKTALPTGGHVFQHTGTTFELNQDIIKTNILTNFELGRDFIGIKLLTKVFTRKCLRTDGHTTDKDRSEKLT